MRETRRIARGANKSFFLTFVLLTASICLTAGCKESKPNYPSRQMPAGISADVTQLQKGHQLFLDKCVSCHGKPSEGRSNRAVFFDPAAPDFTDAHFQKVDPAFLYWRIETGKTVEPYRSQGSVMPAWGLHFTEQEIWQIVAYIQNRAH